MSKNIYQSEQIYNYDDLTARLELCDELQKGLDDIAAGRVHSEEEVNAMLDTIFEGYNLKWHTPLNILLVLKLILKHQ